MTRSPTLACRHERFDARVAAAHRALRQADGPNRSHSGSEQLMAVEMRSKRKALGRADKGNDDRRDRYRRAATCSLHCPAYAIRSDSTEHWYSDAGDGTVELRRQRRSTSGRCARLR